MSPRFTPAFIVTPAARQRLGKRTAALALVVGLAGCGNSIQAPASMLSSQGSPMDVAPLATGSQNVSLLRVTPDNIAQFAGSTAATGSAQGWEYRLGVGDVMQLYVVDEPELSQRAGYRVEGDGAIQVPFLGRVPVDGRSVMEIRADLVSRLSRYRSSPQVDVRITDFNARHVAIVGEVRRPSRQPLTDQPLTAIDAINAAGGFADEPGRANVVLIRNGVEQAVDVQGFLSHGSATPLLRDGDVLRVGGQRARGGRASTPSQTVQIHRTGRSAERITLTTGPVSVAQVAQSALATPGADVFVLRQAATGVQALRLDAIAAQSPVMGGRFELRAGDVVTFAAATPADTNQLMSQLSPALRLLSGR